MSDETPGLTSAELTERAGISPRQLTYWAERGFIHPEGNGGSGNPWEWPESEAEIARRMGRLTAAEWSVEAAARYAREQWPDGEIGRGLRLVVSDG